MDITAHLEAWGGATTTRLLSDAGFDDCAIRRHVRRGDLIAVRRGAYIQPPPPDDVRRVGYARRCAAVARARGSALTHASAVAVWGLPILRTPRQVDVCDEEPERTEHHMNVVRRRIATAPIPVPSWPGVYAVDPAIACLQTAHTEGGLFSLCAADEAAHRGLVTPAEFHDVRTLLGYKRRFRSVGWVLDRVEPKTESPGETVTRIRLAELGIDARAQERIYDRGIEIARVDLLDDRTKTVYEFDGRVKYEAFTGREELWKEKRREDRLRGLGYRVVRVVWDDLDPRRFGELLTQGLPRAA